MEGGYAFTMNRNGRYKICISLLLLMLITGCGPGVEDYSYKVAGDYQLIRSSAHQIMVTLPVNGNASNTIPPKVIKVAWNDKYVIAEQQVLKRRSPNNPNDLYEEPDDKYYYWILDTKIKKVYGPYTLFSFESKKKEFNIPTSLQLKDVDSYPKDH